MMSDADRERLTLPPAHGIFPQHSAPGSYTGTTTVTSASAAPPFAPRPHYNQPHHHHHHQKTHGTAPSSRSGGTSTHTDHVPPSATSSTSTECTCHEVCYYFQQAVFILAIMTGVALVIAGTVIHVQSGELLVLVYIGVLLASVNTVLLMIQCCVRRKQKRRARAYQAARPSAVQASTQTGGAVRYKTLTVGAGGEKPPLMQTLPNEEVQPFQYKHYHVHSPNVGQSAFQDFPLSQDIFAQSPTESAQSKFLHGAPYHRSSSVVSHHRHAKGPAYHKSPPLGQVHRPLLNTLGPQQLPRSDVGPQENFSPSLPPPSYEDLLRSGRLPQEGTIVHLI